jgi:hypothetical protein
MLSCPYGGSTVTTHEAGRDNAIAARLSASRSERSLATLGTVSPLDATLGWIFTAYTDFRIPRKGDFSEGDVGGRP